MEMKSRTLGVAVINSAGMKKTVPVGYNIEHGNKACMNMWDSIPYSQTTNNNKYDFVFEKKP